MIPAAIVGFLLEDFMEVFFDGAIIIVGIMLIITAVLLYLADMAKNNGQRRFVPQCFYHWFGTNGCYASRNFEEWGNYLNFCPIGYR